MEVRSAGAAGSGSSKNLEGLHIGTQLERNNLGWAQKGGKLYSFALNMDMQQASDAAKRIESGNAGLKVLDLTRGTK